MTYWLITGLIAALTAIPTTHHTPPTTRAFILTTITLAGPAWFLFHAYVLTHWLIERGGR